MKKIICIILTVMTVLSLMTAMVFADTEETSAGAASSSVEQYDRLISYLENAKIEHPTDPTKEIKLAAKEITALKNYFSSYITKYELTSDTVDTIIGKVDEIIKIFKESGAEDAYSEKLTPDIDSKLISLIRECAELVNLSCVVNESTRSFDLVDKDTGSTIYTFEGVIKKTGWNANILPAIGAGVVVVAVIILGVVFTKKQNGAKA